MNNTKYAIVEEVVFIDTGSRCCIDFVDELSPDEGIFVGNTSSGFIKVLSENIKTETYPPRCFRINAGAIHQYCFVGKKTVYVSEISPPESLLVHQHEVFRNVSVGRIKIEKRKLVWIKCKLENMQISGTFQLSDSVRFQSPRGSINATEVTKGDELLAMTSTPGRHLGESINEYILEK